RSAAQHRFEGVELARQLLVEPGAIEAVGVGPRNQRGQRQHAGGRGVAQVFGQVQVHAQVQAAQRGPARGERGALRQDADGAKPPQPRQMQHGGIDARIHAKIVATHDNALPPFPFPAPRLAAVHVRFSMRALIKQIGWFLCVGCAAAATHWAVAVGCVEQLGLPPLAANAIGWLVAFVVSFTGHYRLTFRHLASRWTVAARRFFLISACGFLLNEAAYAWLLHITRVRYDALLALILLGLAALTFLASRLWAFRRRPGA